MLSIGIVASSDTWASGMGVTPSGTTASGSGLFLRSIFLRVERGSTPEYSRRKTGSRLPTAISTARDTDPTVES